MPFIPLVIIGISAYGLFHAYRVRASGVKTFNWSVAIPPERMPAAVALVESDALIQALNGVISQCAVGYWSKYTVRQNMITFEFKYEGYHGNLHACFNTAGADIVRALLEAA